MYIVASGGRCQRWAVRGSGMQTRFVRGGGGLSPAVTFAKGTRGGVGVAIRTASSELPHRILQRARVPPTGEPGGIDLNLSWRAIPPLLAMGVVLLRC